MTALVAGLVVGVFAPEPSFAEPAPAHVYTPGDGGPRVSAVPLGGGAGGRVPWKFTVAFRCEDQTVDGSRPTPTPRGSRRPGALDRRGGRAAVRPTGAASARSRTARIGSSRRHATDSTHMATDMRRDDVAVPIFGAKT